jgi:hypothetical protein
LNKVSDGQQRHETQCGLANGAFQHRLGAGRFCHIEIAGNALHQCHRLSLPRFNFLSSTNRVGSNADLDSEPPHLTCHATRDRFTAL